MAHPHVHRRETTALAGRSGSLTILHSTPIVDRGSVFVAHLAYPCLTASIARAAIAHVKRDVAVKHADHAMSAWRCPAAVTAPSSSSKPASSAKKRKASAAAKVDSGFDDDGESRGGAAIRAELNARRAVGYAVVVARVYGCANLGKRRFEHIRERTSAMLTAAGCVANVPAAASGGAFVGEGSRLGGVDALAAALGGAPAPVVAVAAVAAAPDIRGSSDIRALVAEAAERRARALAAAAGKDGMPPTPSDVVDLCDDDDDDDDAPAAKRLKK